MANDWNEDPCVKVARAVAWMSVTRFIPKGRLLGARFLVLGGSGGDVGILHSMLIPSKNIHVVDRNPEALLRVSARFPGVTTERGEFLDVVKRCGRVFMAASVTPLLSDEAAHEVVQALGRHALREQGILLCRLAAQSTSDTKYGRSIVELHHLMETGTNEEVMEWVQGVVNNPNTPPEKVASLTSFLKTEVPSDITSALRDFAVSGAAAISRTVELGDLFMRGSQKVRVDPKGFYFSGPPGLDRSEGIPTSFFLLAAVYRAAPGESVDKFMRRVTRRIIEEDAPDLERIVVDEEVLREKVLGAEVLMGGLSRVAQLFNISPRRIEAWKNKNYEPRDYEGEDSMQLETVRAALFTKFPLGLVRGTIEKKLLKRGVHLEKVLEPISAENVNLSSCDIVFDMFEIGSHAEHEKVIRAAKKYGKPMLYLSRKEASWPEDFRNISEQERLELNGIAEAEMAAHRAVDDEQLEPFLRDFMNLYESGKSHHEMVRPLGRYWRVGKLTNGGQLSTYIRAVEKSERCPAFFRQWREERVKNTVEDVAPLQEVEVRSDLAKEANRVPQNGVHALAVAAPPPPPFGPSLVERTDLAEELELYRGEYNAEKVARERAESIAKGLADEVSKYAERQASWEKREREILSSLEDIRAEKEMIFNASAVTRAAYEKRTAVLTEEVERFKAASPKTTFSSIRGSLTMLVEQGLLTEDEAIQKFWKFAPKE